LTEKEKRDRGLLYNPATDPELISELMRAKDICFKLNATLPSDTAKRREIISELFGEIKAEACVISPFQCDYGYNIKVGENFFVNHNCVILDAAPVTFGDNVFIAPDCGFYTAEHPINIEKRNVGLETCKPITVGNNVWIGGGVRVLAGVTIGDDTVIGAGSVVTSDIPSGVIAFGNPCRVYREPDESELGKR